MFRSIRSSLADRIFRLAKATELRTANSSLRRVGSRAAVQLIYLSHWVRVNRDDIPF